jgi:hypothetical protein
MSASDYERFAGQLDICAALIGRSAAGDYDRSAVAEVVASLARLLGLPADLNGRHHLDQQIAELKDRARHRMMRGENGVPKVDVGW